MAMQVLEEEACLLRERRSLEQLRKEDEERQSTRSVSMTREQIDLALGLSVDDTERMEWDHQGGGLYSDKEGTSSKKRETLESELETSNYEDGDSPSSQNTVLHKWKPQDNQSRSELRNSHKDTLLDSQV